MADQWDQYAVKQAPQADEWSQYAVQPSKSSGVTGSWTPETEDQRFASSPIGRFLIGANKGLEIIPGYKQGMESPDLQDFIKNAPANTSVGGQVAEGLGNVSTMLPMMAPMMGVMSIAGRPILSAALGVGGFNTLKSMLQGNSPQQIGKDTVSGIGQGTLMGAGGIIGSNVTNGIASKLIDSSKITPAVQDILNRIGTGSGQGIANSVTAPSGQKISSGLLGAGLGVISPSSPSNHVTQEQYNDLIDKNADIYRKLINPTKSEVGNVEIKSNKDMNDYFKTMAENGLILNKGSDGKLDTQQAISQLQPLKQQLNDKINGILNNKDPKLFNLEDVRKQAKDQLRGQIKNDKEYEDAASNVDTQIDAAIRANGPMLHAPIFNNFKQGMWSTSYNPLSPNSQTTNRQIGNIAKDMIEKAYPDEDIKGANAQLGNLLTTQTLLQNAHGRPISGGKMGDVAARLMGTAGGYILGHGNPGSEVLGALAGEEIVPRIKDFINDPSRITKSISNNKAQLQIKDSLNR